MADNYTANSGTGLTFAADLISAVLYPRVKVVQGADGSATDVSATNPLPVISGALDDAFTTIPVWLSGGVVVDTPELYPVTTTDKGIIRITTRRAVVEAPDVKIVTLISSAPVPDYSDITQIDGTPIIKDDIMIIDTNPHYFVIPMAISHWRRLTIFVDWVTDSAFDTAATWFLYGSSAVSVDAISLLATAAIAATNGYSFSIGDGAVGQGGTAGGATVATLAHYSVPALNAGWPYVILKMIASVSPTNSGAPRIAIVRMSS